MQWTENITRNGNVIDDAQQPASTRGRAITVQPTGHGM